MPRSSGLRLAQNSNSGQMGADERKGLSPGSKSGDTKYADIRFIRIDDPILIPRGLLDQLPSEPFTPDEWIASYVSHPVNFLYLIMDRKAEEPRIGFFWIQANPLEKCLRILLLSVDENFRMNNPDFMGSVLSSWFKAMTKTIGAKYLVWARHKQFREGRTHHGRLRQAPVFALEV